MRRGRGENEGEEKEGITDIYSTMACTPPDTLMATIRLVKICISECKNLKEWEAMIMHLV